MSDTMPVRARVYIAGPYTKGDVAQNVAAAIHAGEQVAALGFIPCIPHLSHFWHFLHPHEPAFWMHQDFHWLAVCDIVLRLPGDSVGGDQEVELATRLGKKVVHSVEELRIKEEDDHGRGDAAEPAPDRGSECSSGQ